MVVQMPKTISVVDGSLRSICVARPSFASRARCFSVPMLHTPDMSRAPPLATLSAILETVRDSPWERSS
eukprot:3384389-Prorocentrum_lima.AAC.1